MAAIVINIAGSYDDKAIGQAQRDLDKLKGGAAAASAGMAGAFTSAGAKLKTLGASVAATGASFTRGLTLPIVGIGAASIIAFNQVDKALDDVAVATGATGKTLEGLQASFRTVAEGSASSMEDVSIAIGELNTRLGLTGAPLEDVASKMLDLARVTGTDVASATRTVTRAMNDMGIGAADAGPFMDMLLVTSQQTGIGLDTLADKMARFGSPLRQVGIDAETSAAMIGAFEKAGVNTDLVMGSLRISLGKLAKEGAKDLPAALSKAIESIKNAESGGKAAAKAIEIFGSRAGPDMAAAIREGRLEVGDLVTMLQDSEGALATTAAAVEGPQEAMARLKNQATLVGASFATALLPAFEALLPIVQDVANWFKSLSPETIELAVKIAAVAAAIGPLLLIAGKLIGIIGAISTALGFLAANPVVLIIAGIAALVAGLIYAYKNFEGFRNVVDAVWNGIQVVVGAVVDWFMKYVWPILQEAFGYIQTALGVLWKAYATYWGFIFEIVKKVAAWFMEYVWPTLSKVFDGIGVALGLLWEAYKAYWTFILNAVRVVVDWFMTYVWPTLSRVFSMIGTALGVLWDAYKQYWTLILGIIKTVVNWIMETGWPFIRDAFNNMKRGAEILWQGIQAAFTAIKSHIETQINLVLGILRGIGSIVSTVVGFFLSIQQGIRDKLMQAVTFVSGIPGKIIEALGSLASTLYSAGSDLIQGLINGIGSMGSALWNYVTSFIRDNVVNGVKSVLRIGSPSRVMMDVGKWIPIGLARGIASTEQAVRDAARKLAEASTAEARKAAKDALQDAQQAARELARRTAQVIRDSAVEGLDRVKDKAREVLDYVRGVRDDVRAFGGVMSVEFDRGTLTASGILAQMRDRLSAARAFTAAVTQLRGLGLNNASLQEIIKAGPESGREIAQALAAGGRSAVAEVNALEAALAGTGAFLGDVGARSQYGTSASSAQGVLDTTVQVQSGAVVINFGAGVNAQDAAEIRTEIAKAVQQGLRELAREIRAS